MKTKTIGLGVLLSVAAAAICFASNPTLGTWKLNESKSTFGDGAGKAHWWCGRKLATSKNARSKELTLTVKKLTPSGPERWTENSMRSPAMRRPNQRSFKKSDDNPIATVSQKDGKTVGEGTIVVAADRKSRTVTSTMTNANGVKVTSTFAFDKS